MPHGTTCESMVDVKALPEWTVWSSNFTSNLLRVTEESMFDRSLVIVNRAARLRWV